MYTPRHFEERDAERLLALVTQLAFGAVVAVGDDGEPEIPHLPVHLERGAGPGRPARLLVHVARRNPLAELVGRRMTVVLQGPHAYVTPRWYTAPTQQVPTWNYAVVHARGPTRRLSDDELRAQLTGLAEAHEAGAAEPWTPARAGALVDELLPGIVGFAVEIDRLEGKYKLSQNRAPEDRAGVVLGQSARRGPDDEALLALMGHEEARRGELVISTDRARVDLDVVMGFMARSYWGQAETPERMARALRHGLVFGVYRDGAGAGAGAGAMVGFARVITDFATFSYLSDVFVDERARGAGVGRWLVDTIYAHPALLGFRRHFLMTRDAHALYRRVGFGALGEPFTAMEWKP